MVATGVEFVADLRREARVELDLIVGHDHPETRRIDRLLWVHTQVDCVDQHLYLGLRMVVEPSQPSTYSGDPLRKTIPGRIV